ncbi:MAG: SigB/SigF/SigG family RNA polymerase sigma factor [Acidimicrobiales bacterium]
MQEATRDDFIEYRRTGSRQLRDQLIAEHIGLARRLAGRFTHRGESFDDLSQVACLGLVKAVDGFEPEMGNAFTSYACVTILGELKRYFRDHGWAVRAPRHLQEVYLNVKQAIDDLSHELGRVPTVPDVAGHLGLSEEEVLQAMEAGNAYRSDHFDAAVDGEDGPGTQLAVEEGGFELADDVATVRESLQALSERDRQILFLRYFEDMTQTEIAGVIGASQIQVSRRLSRSLTSLRAAQGTVGPAAPTRNRRRRTGP